MVYLKGKWPDQHVNMRLYAKHTVLVQFLDIFCRFHRFWFCMPITPRVFVSGSESPCSACASAQKELDFAVHIGPRNPFLDGWLCGNMTNTNKTYQQRNSFICWTPSSYFTLFCLRRELADPGEHEKMVILPYADNEGPDQSAYSQGLRGPLRKP